MPKKTKTKKQAATGRGVLCGKCYIKMVQQATIEGTWDWHCLKCGLRHTGASGPGCDEMRSGQALAEARNFKLE
jgi:hypothetical protein